MNRVMWAAVLAGLLLGGISKADTYWIAWEGNDPNDWPEYDGWIRCYERPGADRTIENGVLTYASTDTKIFDYYERYRPGALDCGPNELFVLEWRLWVESVTNSTDPGVCVHSDESWTVGLSFNAQFIHSSHEHVDIPIPPGDWHAYALISPDMRSYDLFADGSLIWQGSFAQRYMQSRVTWGDGAQGVASVHHWDYLRFGVVLPPQAGDVNCDGSVGFADINSFVLALTDQTQYHDTYPGCWTGNADINEDGAVDFGDINPFVALLSS